jgi:hypothetical protein
LGGNEDNHNEKVCTYSILYNKLQTLSQGYSSVDGYFMEMKVVIIRANIFEDRKATIARFLKGLNKVIANVVELHHYMEIKDMVYMVVKMEKQLRRKGSAKPNGYLGFFQVGGQILEERVIHK